MQTKNKDFFYSVHRSAQEYLKSSSKVSLGRDKCFHFSSNDDSSIIGFPPS